MKIQPNEIQSVEDAGTLNGSPVRLIRLKGGLWLAAGRAEGKNQEEVLTAGSHSGIVKYNLKKQFKGFQPVMMKSENMNESRVDEHSHFLSSDLRKSGHGIYSVQQGNKIEFQITKDNIKIGSVQSEMNGDVLLVNTLGIKSQFTQAMAGATSEKATECGLKSVKIKVK